MALAEIKGSKNTLCGRILENKRSCASGVTERGDRLRPNGWDWTNPWCIPELCPRPGLLGTQQAFAKVAWT